jgi:hypothetical protein
VVREQPAERGRQAGGPDRAELPAPEVAEEPRTFERFVTVPSTGAKLFVLAGLLVAVLSCYLLLAPVQRPDANNGVTDCGTVVNPPSTDFLAGLCGQSVELRRAQVLATGAAALLLGVGGFAVFGTRQRRERPAAFED